MIDFNMIVDINNILFNNNVDFKIHNFKSCGDTRVYLTGSGDINKAVKLINEYLYNKFLIIEHIDDLNFNVKFIS